MGRRSVLLSLLGLLIVVLAGARPYLATAVRDYINGVLEDNGAYTGRVADVDIALWRGGGEIRGLEIVKRSGVVPVPLIELPRAYGSLRWEMLFRHGELVLEATVEGPALHLVAGRNEAEQQYGAGGFWQASFEALTLIRVDRLTVRDGRFHFHDFHSNPRVDVSPSDISLVADNLTNVRDDSEPLPAHVHLTAKPMTAGQLLVTADLDPLARFPRFDVQAKLTGMKLQPWNSLLIAYGGIEPGGGILAHVRQCAPQRLRGGVLAAPGEFGVGAIDERLPSAFCDAELPSVGRTGAAARARSAPNRSASGARNCGGIHARPPSRSAPAPKARPATRVENRLGNPIHTHERPIAVDAPRRLPLAPRLVAVSRMCVVEPGKPQCAFQQPAHTRT